MGKYLNLDRAKVDLSKQIVKNKENRQRERTQHKRRTHAVNGYDDDRFFRYACGKDQHGRSEKSAIMETGRLAFSKDR